MAQILVVEDDITGQELLIDALMVFGHTVIAAENGAQGLQLYRNNFFDLAIVDMEMPVMNGLEMIRAIREEDSDFSVIAVTGYSHIYMAMEVLSLNVEAFLKKPLNLKELAQIIEGICTRHNAY